MVKHLAFKLTATFLLMGLIKLLVEFKWTHSTFSGLQASVNFCNCHSIWLEHPFQSNFYFANLFERIIFVSLVKTSESASLFSNLLNHRSFSIITKYLTFVIKASKIVTLDSNLPGLQTGEYKILLSFGLFAWVSLRSSRDMCFCKEGSCRFYLVFDMRRKL